MKHMLKAIRTLPALATFAVLAGCTTPMASQKPYDELHKVRVAEMIERLELYIRPEGMNISARDRQAMLNFFKLYGAEGDGIIYMNVPASTNGSNGLRQAEAEIQSMMGGLGLPQGAIQVGSYPAQPGQPAPIMLSFRRLTTLPGNCHNGYDFGRVYNGQPYQNFGCASQANFAAMVNDPRQILDGYGSDPSSIARRITVFEKYVAGENTASALPARQQVTPTGN